MYAMLHNINISDIILFFIFFENIQTYVFPSHLIMWITTNAQHIFKTEGLCYLITLRYFIYFSINFLQFIQFGDFSHSVKKQLKYLFYHSTSHFPFVEVQTSLLGLKIFNNYENACIDNSMS